MQYEAKSYNQLKHDIFVALAIQQPYASNLAEGSHTIAFVDKNIEHRGQVLLCSTYKPEIYGLECGATLAFADIVDVKHSSELTQEEWEEAGIEREARDRYKHSYVVFIENPEKVIEMPFSGDPGLQNAVFDKDEIMKYPIVLHVDMKGVKKAIKNEKNRI